MELTRVVLGHLGWAQPFLSGKNCDEGQRRAVPSTTAGVEGKFLLGQTGCWITDFIALSLARRADAHLRIYRPMVNGAMLLVNGGCFVYSANAFSADGTSLVQPGMSVLLALK